MDHLSLISQNNQKMITLCNSRCIMLFSVQELEQLASVLSVVNAPIQATVQVSQNCTDCKEWSDEQLYIKFYRLITHESKSVQ